MSVGVGVGSGSRCRRESARAAGRWRWLRSGSDLQPTLITRTAQGTAILAQAGMTVAKWPRAHFESATMDASCFINRPTVHVLPSPSCIHVSPPPPRQPPPFLRLTGELECRVCEACTAMDARPPRLLHATASTAMSSLFVECARPALHWMCASTAMSCGYYCANYRDHDDRRRTVTALKYRHMIRHTTNGIHIWRIKLSLISNLRPTVGIIRTPAVYKVLCCSAHF